MPNNDPEGAQPASEFVAVGAYGYEVVRGGPQSRQRSEPPPHLTAVEAPTG
jgi:hypothetical protein